MISNRKVQAKNVFIVGTKHNPTLPFLHCTWQRHDSMIDLFFFIFNNIIISQTLPGEKRP